MRPILERIWSLPRRPRALLSLRLSKSHRTVNTYTPLRPTKCLRAREEAFLPKVASQALTHRGAVRCHQAGSLRALRLQRYAAYEPAAWEVDKRAAAEQQRRADKEARQAEERAAKAAEVSTEELRAARQQGHEQRTAAGKAAQTQGKHARKRQQQDKKRRGGGAGGSGAQPET